MCAFRPCISFTPKNTRHRSPTDLCNAVENQAAGLFFIYRFVLSLQEGRRPSRPGGRRAPLISIHAPARGATGLTWMHYPWTLFQFTPLREGRPMPQANMGIKLAISIHAPARGATLQRSEYIGGNRFQFTPLREGRLQQLRLAAVSPLFQFTPLREGRRTVSSTRACLPLFQFTPLREGRRRWGQGRRSRPADFNSRPCERGDTAAAVDQERMNISIHAPARGATGAGCPHIKVILDFNSRPCERGDSSSAARP